MNYFENLACAWAAANGHDCPDTGKVPGRIVAAYDQAHSHGGN